MKGEKKVKAATKRGKLMGPVRPDEVIDVARREWSPQAGRKVIPIETVIALRKRNLSMAQIASVLGCSKQNIQYRLREIASEIETVDDFKKHKADILAIHQRRILNAVTPANLSKASLKDKGIAFGIMFDKERLERGKSTSNILYGDIVRIRQEKLKELENLDNAEIVG